MNDYLNGVKKIKEYLVKSNKMHESNKLYIWFRYDYDQNEAVKIDNYFRFMNGKVIIYAISNPERVNVTREWYKDYIDALERYFKGSE